MAKMIKIERCNECLYFGTALPDMFTEGGQYCTHIKVVKDDFWKRICSFNEVTPVKFPKWCPLENV